MAQYLGVEYIYAPEEPITNSVNHNSYLTPSSLKVMPLNWISQLHEATTRLKAKQILSLIGQIPLEYADLAQDLTKLVDNFEFEDLLALTEDCLEDQLK
jgi:hypothetical protein